jgi:septum formation protein
VPSPPRLILASASPRRQQLLREAGYEFVVRPAHINEDDHPPMLPADLAEFLAMEKAQAVARHHPQDVVLGADTVVAFGDTILGKPDDADDARRMLGLLAGTTHVVITGVAVVHAAAQFSAHSRVMSAVRMRELAQDEIDRYITRGDWRGKAGGYGIQDDDPFVTRLSGCHTNIVGLPVPETKRLLALAGVMPLKG